MGENSKFQTTRSAWIALSSCSIVTRRPRLTVASYYYGYVLFVPVSLEQNMCCLLEAKLYASSYFLKSLTWHVQENIKVATLRQNWLRLMFMSVKSKNLLKLGCKTFFSSAIMIDRAEVILHDVFGDAVYWEVSISCYLTFLFSFSLAAWILSAFLNNA